MNDKKSKPTRAIALLSGGLDSTLAIKLMIEQGIEILAVNFVGPFCTCSPRSLGGCHMASEVARTLGVKIRVLSKGMEYMKVVENPRYGRGKGINPCIDCRIFMLRKVAGMMDESNASFVITGEVLGQRPMSQHWKALQLIENESGLAGKILRPLCAHLLKPTAPEINGEVDRRRLLSIRGRSRRKQLSLASEKGIDIFSCAAGGCLLTDPVIAGRLEDLFMNCPDYTLTDVRLATFGRHFRLREDLRAIVGRNQYENERMLRIAPDYPRMELSERAGPFMLMSGNLQAADLTTLGRLLRFYAKKVVDHEVSICWSSNSQSGKLLVRGSAEAQEISAWRV
jgi:hypothetical protein